MLAHDILLQRDKKTVREEGSKSLYYVILLGVVKFFKCIGVFVISDLLKSVHVVQLLFFLKLGASFVLLPLQKPFGGSRIHKSQWMKIIQLSLFGCFVNVFWLYGITLCGPLRSILIFEHSAPVVIAALSTIVKGKTSPSKVRGTVLLCLGFLSLIVLDSDISVEHEHAETHGHHSGLNHVFYHAVQWFGLADHKGGVIILILALMMQAGYDNAFRLISVQIGGTKRLYSLTTFLSTLLIIPVVALTFFIHSYSYLPWFDFLIGLCLTVLFVMVADFYADSICANHIDQMSSARWCPILMFILSFFIGHLWFEPYRTVTTSSTGTGFDTVEHGLSGGVIVTLVFFILATYILTSPNTRRAMSAQFVGMSSSGLPLYVYGEDFLQKTSHSVMVFAKSALKQILSSSDSRRIFYFLCANLAFCGVEFLYGVLTNSLGLISDGFHMLFDCSALVMGLVASVLSQKAASRLYSYGYGRVEVLSGFINALFLIVIAFFIFLEALERLYAPPEVHTEKLLIVSVAGLIVNLFGIFAFHGNHGHSHGGGGDDSHGHSHNANMQGVFLHVLADTLGSVAVIISSLLIEYFGWLWVDPFCSLLLSILIFLSVLPLLQDSAAVLLQKTPQELEEQFPQLLNKILRLEGVQSYSRAHAWQLKSNINVASVHVQVSNETNQQRATQQILNVFKGAGVQQVIVQIEKDPFFQHILALCPSYEVPVRINRNILHETLMAKAI